MDNIKRKIISIFVCTTMIVTIPAVGTMWEKELKEEQTIDDTSERANIKNMVSDVFIQDVVLGDGDVFYAYNAFDPTGYLRRGPVSFESDNPATITLLAPTTSSDFIAGGTWAVDTWYGCEYGTGRLYIIDESTGEMTLIGGGGASLNGLAYDLTTGNMYGASDSSFYTVDMSSGGQIWVGPFNSCKLMVAIAFDGEGNLYGIDLGTDSLYSIDSSTGEAILIGSLGIWLNYAQDMAYDIDNGILYLSAYIEWEGGYLCTCNVTTGKLTRIGRFQGGSEITGFAIPYIPGLPPEKPERPDGPSGGVVGVEYTFSTSTTDPDGDQVWYMWDWGDGNVSGWLGPYDSETTVYANHTWTEAGDYNIIVKAKDIYDSESAWSDPKTIHIINIPILEIGNITGGLGKIRIIIKNIGSVNAFDVDWNLMLNGGWILLGRQKTGKIAGISAHGEVSVASGLILGFGETVVTVCAVCAEIPESSATKEQDAFVFLFFIKIIDVGRNP